VVWCPSFESRLGSDGRVEYRIGHELVDEFLEFVSGRARPNTVRAYAHDLSVFFSPLRADSDSLSVRSGRFRLRSMCRPYDTTMRDRSESRETPGRSAWNVLIGRPLRTSEASKKHITPVEGLSALSLDALTSVAYGPEAIIVVLAVAGGGALHIVLPITVAIVVLLAILVFSYRQVIDAYPGGGGAYAVSRANLGPRASLVAGASLIVDYTLTVAVSIAAGVGALTSAFPSLTSATVPLCLGFLALITLMNLRGLGEAARAFLLPTMLFIFGLLAIIAVGLIHPLALNVPQPGHSLLSTHGLQVVSLLLILKAFSSGCSALTGVEAIANGVPLFKEPRVVRAKRTELMLGVILGLMLLGLAVLARRWHIGPRSNQTVLSQIMGEAVGRHWAYYIVSLTITIVLALAANTSFGGPTDPGQLASA
jgi:amino acid transporter